MSTASPVITSTANPAVRHFRSLEQKKYRDETGLFAVEGLRHVSQALLAGWEPELVLNTPRLRTDAALRRLLAPHKIQRLEVTPELIGRLTGRDNPEDIVATFRQRLAPATRLQAGAWVALEEIRDPGNLGTIIRTAEAAGAEGIVLIGNCCDPWSPEVIRASVGSFARIPICRLSLKEYMSWHKTYDGNIIGTRMTAADDYRQTAYKLPSLLLMGSEHAGLSPEAAGSCTQMVRIPMKGEIESLNVATATALILFELMRKN